MRKLYTLILGGLVCSMGYAQTPSKLVLIEAFSNASCPPCAANNPQMNALLSNNTNKAVSVKFQANFPGFDPMNAQNPTENNGRRTYYGVNAVPGVMVDGTTGPINSGSINQSNIDDAYNVGTDVDLTLSHSLSANFDSISINVSATNLGTANITGNLVLHVALVEREINFPEPPGSTNEKDFYGVMRKMYPGLNGTPITGGLSVGVAQTFSMNEVIPSYIYNYGEIAVVAWVQDVTTKEVFNAAYSAPQPLPSNAVDGGLENVTQDISDLCAESFEPKVRLKNEGNSPITSAVVSYTLNGGAPVDFNYTGSLAPNATEIITFPNTTLNGGQTNTISFELNDVNNGSFDFNTMNNSTPAIDIPLLPTGTAATPVQEDFESTSVGQLPTDFIFSGDVNNVIVINQTIVNNLSRSLGGFGASENSLFVDYYVKQAGETTFITVPKVDLTSSPGSIVSFNYAYAQFNAGSNDYLAFEVSRDCGATWDILWDASGASLATASARTGRFFPDHSTTQTDWRKIVIALAPYGNETELVCRFRCVSDYGNSLFIDDINIANATSSVENIEEKSVSNAFADVRVFPNPANKQFTINMNTSEEKEMSISVINVLGQVVYSKNERVFGEQNLEISTEGMASGMYQVIISNGNDRMVKKLTIQK